MGLTYLVSRSHWVLVAVLRAWLRIHFMGGAARWWRCVVVVSPMVGMVLALVFGQALAIRVPPVVGTVWIIIALLGFLYLFAVEVRIPLETPWSDEGFALLRSHGVCVSRQEKHLPGWVFLMALYVFDERRRLRFRLVELSESLPVPVKGCGEGGQRPRF